MYSSMRSPLLGALLVTTCVAPAQVAWQRLTGLSQVPGTRVNHLAWTTLSGVVMFGGEYEFSYPGGDAYSWNGLTWTQVAGPGVALADAAVGVLNNLGGQWVVFGGHHATAGAGTVVLSGDTWLYTTSGWTKAQTPAPPPARDRHAMGGYNFPPFPIGVVLFGGNDGTNALGDTWTWEGAAWAQRNHSVAPAPRYDHAMSGSLLFGGRNGTTWFNDTWRYDRYQWTPLAPVVAPSPRARHAMAPGVNGAGVVLFGGEGRSGLLGDTWEWDGNLWVQRHPANHPPAVAGHAMTLDSSGGVLLIGGEDALGRHGDTWRWDGVDWTRVAQVAPPTRVAPIAYRANQQATALVGGLAETFSASVLMPDAWQWNGREWTELPSLPRNGDVKSLADDAARNRLVAVFGSGDTWEFDGSAWRPAATNNPFAFNAGLTYDSRLGVVLAVDGSTNDPSIWRWNGTAWLAVHSGSAGNNPTYRSVAYDSFRGRLLYIGDGTLSEWNGSQWSVVATAPNNGEHWLAYDAARRVMIVEESVFGAVDTFEWDGTSLRQRMTGFSPPPVYAAGLAYDAARELTLMYGGRSWFGSKNDPQPYLSAYGPAYPAATTPYGVGCPGSAGVPALSGQGQAWLGRAVELHLGPLPGGAPVFLNLGVSRTSWLGAPLPFSLAPLGGGLCAVQASIDLTLQYTVGTVGGIDVSVPLPATSALLGAEVYAQGGAIDAAANALGFSWSNGVAVTLGGL